MLTPPREQSSGIPVFDCRLKPVAIGLEIFHFLIFGLEQLDGLAELGTFICPLMLFVNEANLYNFKLLPRFDNLGTCFM